jgi:hypothetical protein
VFDECRLLLKLEDLIGTNLPQIADHAHGNTRSRRAKSAECFTAAGCHVPAGLK